MPQIEIEQLDPELAGVLLVSIPFVRTAFGATHGLLDSNVTERLGLPDLASLEISARETYCVNGIWGPIVSTADCYIAVTSGLFLAVIAKPDLSHSVATELKPTRGLFVPEGTPFGIQTLVTNRASHLVITRRSAHNQSLPFSSQGFAKHWHHTDSDPAQSESDR